MPTKPTGKPVGRPSRLEQFNFIIDKAERNASAIAYDAKLLDSRPLQQLKAMLSEAKKLWATFKVHCAQREQLRQAQAVALQNWEARHTKCACCWKHSSDGNLPLVTIGIVHTRTGRRKMHAALWNYIRVCRECRPYLMKAKNVAKRLWLKRDSDPQHYDPEAAQAWLSSWSDIVLKEPVEPPISRRIPTTHRQRTAPIHSPQTWRDRRRWKSSKK